MVNRKGLSVVLLALLVAPFSWAAPVIGDLFDRHGFAIQPGSGNLVASSSLSLNGVAPNGTRAVVPVSAAVHVPKSVLVKNAVKIARAGSAIGVGFLAWETYNLIKDSGLTICPAPDFFCTPGSSDPMLDGYKYQFSDQPATQGYDTTAMCKTRVEAAGDKWGKITRVDANNLTCWRESTNSPGVFVQMYSLIRMATQTCSTGGAPPCTAPASAPTPMTDTQFETALTAKVDSGVQPTPGMSDSGWNSSMYYKLWKAVENDAKIRATQIPQGTIMLDSRLGSDSLVFVSGPGVETPEITTKTKLISNADGSTSTETTKEKTTFTPGQNGTTVANAEPVAKSSTVVTTTTTNNTTNQTTINTETQTPPATPEQKDAAAEFCKLNPDILACKMMGEPIEAVPVPDRVLPVAITPDSGWGASNGACPAPGSFTAMGQTIPVPWDVFCQFAQGIRPFLIAVGYMIAVGGFLGLARKD